MIATNELKDAKCHKREILEPLVVLIAPFAPFIAEELWHNLGHSGSIHANGIYPVHNDAFLIQNSIEYPICINGKKRGVANFPVDATAQFIETETLKREDVQKWIDGNNIKKFIVVQKRTVNIVI